MKKTLLLLPLTTCLVTSSHAQTPLVGPGSNYTDVFSPSASVTYDVPGGGLLSITLSDGSATASSGVWNLTAQGGANASILLSLTESAARTTLTGTGLEFGISNDNDSLLGLLGTGASVHYAWEAVAFFDSPGIDLNYMAETVYTIRFDVDGNNGLLDTVAGLTPSFTFELIDGLGNALAGDTSGTLVNIASILGTGVPSGTIALDYTLGTSVPAGPLGIRFRGEALVQAAALSLGTEYASVSNLMITATPVPEPGGALLAGLAGLMVLLPRKRRAV